MEERGLSARIHIIGMGDDGLEGLTAAARQYIEAAEVIMGGPRIMDAVPPGMAAERVMIESDLDQLVQQIKDRWDRRIVLISPGDPLFYGVARYVCEKLGKEHFEVLPHVSSMQLAFARVKESWDEAYLADLATTPLSRVCERIRTVEKAGLFTNQETPPASVAEQLLAAGIDYFSAYICENLGSPDERVTRAELDGLARESFSPLNVMILIRKPDLPDRPVEMIGRRLFGNADETFLQSQPKRGLLTPSEVRVLALAELDIGPRSLVWDVGAGSGAVAIEAAGLADAGTVFAIEMDPEDHQLIVANADRFGAENLVPILGTAPDAWASLPDPDAIFVGGTGRAVSKIVQQAVDRLKSGGRLVVNVASLENVTGVHRVLAQHARIDQLVVRMISIAQATDQFDQLRFESMNPTFLLCCVKTSVDGT